MRKIATKTTQQQQQQKGTRKKKLGKERDSLIH